jgi:hypothetical protein
MFLVMAERLSPSKARRSRRGLGARVADRARLPVWLPVGHSPDADLVTEWEGRLARVQVKTSTLRQRGRYLVTLCTRGGNRSWSGIVKHFSADRCDFLFVHCA